MHDGYGHQRVGSCRIYVVGSHEYVAELAQLPHNKWYHHACGSKPPSWFLPVMCTLLLRDKIGIEPLIALEMACEQGYVMHPLVVSSCDESSRGLMMLSADEPIAKSTRMSQRWSSEVPQQGKSPNRSLRSYSGTSRRYTRRCGQVSDHSQIRGRSAKFLKLGQQSMRC